MKKKIITITPEQQKKEMEIPIIPSKIKVAAYCRVSSETDEQLNSLSVQRRYFDELLSSHPNWENAGVYYDEGISGTGIKRRVGFNKMVEDALAGNIDMIIVKSISRFARNTVDTLNTIRKLKAKGIRVFFEKENIDTLDSKGEFILTIMSSLAQQESQSLSENVKWGVRKSFAEGKVAIHNQLYGFKYQGKYSFKVDEKQAKIVCLIYKMYLERNSRRSIALYLNENKIPTAWGRPNTKWTTKGIKDILTNEKYAGDALLQKNYTPDFMTHKVVKNDGKLTKYLIKNNHDAIIPLRTWELTQEMLTSGRYEFVQQPLFSFMIKCSLCEGWYQSKSQYRSYFAHTISFYQCENKQSKTRLCKKSCDITEEQLVDICHTAISKLYDDFPEVIDDLCSITEKVIEGKRKQNSIKKEIKNKPSFPITNYEKNCYPVMIDYMEITSTTLTIHFLNKDVMIENYIKWKPREHFKRKTPPIKEE